MQICLSWPMLTSKRIIIAGCQSAQTPVAKTLVYT
jgi:hypothetical protein